LTARGRLVARALLLATVVILIVGVAASTRASSAEPSQPSAGVSVVVEPGDTLWNIADRYAAGHERGWAMREIRRLNRLADDRIEVGQELVLPTP
jgi:LysM repeat protein